ncbi:MAG: TonB-dependent receptor [Candidatus Riflebacteria bacterium]|nr:TonB-dependent receptor [Candidatus Riflebacteria bacterium]
MNKSAGILNRIVGLELRGTGRPFTRALIALAIAGSALAAEPQKQPAGGLMNLDMEQLTTVPLGNVYGASKYKQKSTQAPATVSVITALDIKKYGYRTIADILKAVRGFYLTDDRSYTYIGVRGFGRPANFNNRILILVDNHRLNDLVYGAVYVGEDGVIDVDLIDRVEIVRGPSSSLYGTGAFFAIINIITRDVRSQKRSELAGAYGGYRYHKGRFTLAKQFEEGSTVLVSASNFGTEGDPRLFFPEFDDPATNFGLAENVDWEKAANQFGKVTWRDFTLEVARHTRTRCRPTAPYGTNFNSSDNTNVDDLEYVDLKYEHAFPRKDLNLMVRAYTNKQHYMGMFAYTNPEGALDLNYGLSDSTWWGGEVQLNKRFSKTTRVMVGGEYQRNSRQDQLDYNTNPYVLNFEDRRSSWLWAAYFEAEVELIKGLTLNAGVREDYFAPGGYTTNPRIALIGRPRDTTVLKLLYGTAFRAAHVFEMDVTAPTAVKPETIATYEGVWEERFGENVRSTLSYYYYQMYGLIEEISTSATSLGYGNSDTIDAKGLEFELAVKRPSGVEGRLSYTIQKTRKMVTDAVLSNSPQNMLKVNVSVPLSGDKHFLSLETQYMSSRYTATNALLDAYAVANLTFFSPKLVRDLDVSATVYNLFNEKYEDPGGGGQVQDRLWMNGRTFRVKSTIRF